MYRSATAKLASRLPGGGPARPAPRSGFSTRIRTSRPSTASVWSSSTTTPTVRAAASGRPTRLSRRLLVHLSGSHTDRPNLGGPVLDVAYEYNINSDAPVDPLNPFALGNSLAAYAFGYGAENRTIEHHAGTDRATPAFYHAAERRRTGRPWSRALTTSSTGWQLAGRQPRDRHASASTLRAL